MSCGGHERRHYSYGRKTNYSSDIKGPSSKKWHIQKHHFKGALRCRGKRYKRCLRRLSDILFEPSGWWYDYSSDGRKAPKGGHVERSTPQSARSYGSFDRFHLHSLGDGSHRYFYNSFYSKSAERRNALVDYYYKSTYSQNSGRKDRYSYFCNAIRRGRLNNGNRS